MLDDLEDLVVAQIPDLTDQDLTVTLVQTIAVIKIWAGEEFQDRDSPAAVVYDLIDKVKTATRVVEAAAPVAQDGVLKMIAIRDYKQTAAQAHLMIY